MNTRLTLLRPSTLLPRKPELLARLLLSGTLSLMTVSFPLVQSLVSPCTLEKKARERAGRFS